MLQVLNLEGNQIKEISGLQSLKRLRVLNFSKNQLESLEGLKDLMNLQDLNLSGNNLQNYAKLTPLGNLISLKILTLADNSLDADRIKDIFKSHPFQIYI